jgi:hypothetical protein
VEMTNATKAIFCTSRSEYLHSVPTRFEEALLGLGFAFSAYLSPLLSLFE